MNSRPHELKNIVEVPIEDTTEIIPAVLGSIPSPNGGRVKVYVDSRREDPLSREIMIERLGTKPGGDLVSELCDPGGRVLDLGCHVGSFALRVAVQGFRVLAVDASPENVALLRASAALNGLHQVQVVCAAVGDRVGTIDFAQNGPHGMVDDTSDEHDTVTVPLTTVPRLLADAHWDNPDFIKMDIEGSEPKAIRGMRDLLKREDAPPIFYESNAPTLGVAGETPESLLAELEKSGYQNHLVWAKRYMPVRSDDFHPEVVIDYLALKVGYSGRLGSRFIGRHKPRETAIQRICFACDSPHKDQRIYLGAVLRRADPDMRADTRVQDVLRRLALDPVAEVREAAAWFANENGRGNV